ncbi:hypothetical protein GCM10023322_56120 [Rugosimonospora acidiphila]|uniref:Uncharacterized protein n=1 Tax=Rugosimonospora acidiphila TaxID=556531 RepID=A0ABP9SDX8_9ACTN
MLLPAPVQEVIWGRALELPLFMVVKPKVLPLPLGRTVIVYPLLLQLKVPLQVVETFCGAVMAMVTVQSLSPVTVTEVLYRSPQTVPGVIDAVQLLAAAASSVVAAPAVRPNTSADPTRSKLVAPTKSRDRPSRRTVER